MKCKPPPSIASSFADSVSISAPSVAVNSSRKQRRMRARLFSNASRYMYRSGRVPGTREIIAHPNYIVVYQVMAERIEVVSVLHARQEYPA